MTTFIPKIDFNPYLQGSEKGKRLVASQIGEACRKIGFFTLIGHGVSLDLIKKVFFVSKEFHQLPLKEKEEIHQIIVGITPFPQKQRILTPNRI